MQETNENTALESKELTGPARRTDGFTGTGREVNAHEAPRTAAPETPQQKRHSRRLLKDMSFSHILGAGEMGGEQPRERKACVKSTSLQQECRVRSCGKERVGVGGWHR